MNALIEAPKVSVPSVFVLTPNPFPIGNVATNRFSTYAKVLASLGCNVKVLVLKGTEDPKFPVNAHRVGCFEGVRYEYMASTSLWDTGAPLWKKVFLYVAGAARALSCLRRERPSSVILYTNDLLYIVLFGLAARLFSFRYIIDKSEYPIVYRRKASLYRSAYLKAFQIFHGIIVMTRELRDYYSSIKGVDADLFLLPMSVDLARFSSVECSRDDGVPYFGCVFGVHNRDCISDTIRAFDVFCRESAASDVRLRLVGDFENLVDRAEVAEILRATQFRDRVDFRGVVVATEIPVFLKGAVALVTTPRAYASGGFPTKLGEYLATGNPVIATSAGEVPLYLESLKNCFLARPADVIGIAEMMRLVWSSPEFASEVGKAGQRLASDVFNVESYADELIKFVGK